MTAGESRLETASRMMTDEQSAKAQAAKTRTSAATSVTVATYEQIASNYHEKWHDRSAIQDHLRRFVDMMRVYQLAGFPVADIGCGPGFDAHLLRQFGLQVVCLDLSLAMMNAGRPVYGGHYVQADMRFLPLVARMGGLWVSASFLHVPRAESPAVLGRFAELLVPGGLLYLSLKAGQGSEWTATSHEQPLPRYFVYWRPDQLDDMLRQAGFQVVEGWVSPVSASTTWLIRFARKANTGRTHPLNLA